MSLSTRLLPLANLRLVSSQPPRVEFGVTAGTERQQVGRCIIAALGAETNVMDLQAPAGAAELARPAVPVEDLSDHLPLELAA